MPGNSLGEVFRLTTWGESHGRAVGVVLDGCPAGLKLSREDIQRELDRRRVGQSSVTSSRQEGDQVEILSGVFEGCTTGTPIAMLVWNEDADSSKYDKIRDLFRPGHADYTYFVKYGIRDHRGGGRSSARETVGRVAAGGVAKRLLAEHGMVVTAYTRQVGGVEIQTIDLAEIEKNAVRAPDREAAARMVERILEVKAEGDSIGGIIEVLVTGMVAGLGEPVFDKLDADLAKALFSIGAVKGVEFGDGFRMAKQRGSEVNDPMLTREGEVIFESNHAGGLLGGISSGADLLLRMVVKPTSSISKRQRTIDLQGQPSDIEVEGRHDPCICPRVVPVAEAMVALVLADHLLRQRTSRLAEGTATSDLEQGDGF